MATRPAQRASRTRGSETPTVATHQQVSLEGLVDGPLASVVVSSWDDQVQLAPPLRGGVELPLPLDRPFHIAFRDRNVPCHVTAVLTHAPHPGAPYFLGRICGPVVRNQRREHVRVPACLPIVLKKVDGSDDDGHVVATTVDASMGGLQVMSRHQFLPGEDLMLTLESSTGVIRARVKVVRTMAEDDGRGWRVALQITDISAAEKRALNGYLLDRQRTLRRRELGLE